MESNLKWLWLLLPLGVLLGGVGMYIDCANINKKNSKEVIKEIEIKKYIALDRFEINEVISGMIASGKLEPMLEFYTGETKIPSIAYYILTTAINDGIPVNLFFALAKCESSYNEFALNVNRNHTYDKGLFQINTRKKTNELYDLATNCQAASWFLKTKYKKCGSWEESLIIFNNGNSKKVYNGTIKHLARILAEERRLNKKFCEWVNK